MVRSVQKRNRERLEGETHQELVVRNAVFARSTNRREQRGRKRILRQNSRRRGVDSVHRELREVEERLGQDRPRGTAASLRRTRRNDVDRALDVVVICGTSSSQIIISSFRGEGKKWRAQDSLA